MPGDESSWERREANWWKREADLDGLPWSSPVFLNRERMKDIILLHYKISTLSLITGAPLSYEKKLSPPAASNVSLLSKEEWSEIGCQKSISRHDGYVCFSPTSNTPVPGCVCRRKSLPDEKYGLSLSWNRLQIKTWLDTVRIVRSNVFIIV